MESLVSSGWARATELRRELRVEWAELWRTRLDDALRAEGISVREFERLFVERGEILFATRDFKAVSFRSILERHMGSDAAARLSPEPVVGGWGRFIREYFVQPRDSQKRYRPEVKVDASQQKRKNGRGWLNLARSWKRSNCS